MYLSTSSILFNFGIGCILFFNEEIFQFNLYITNYLASCWIRNFGLSSLTTFGIIEYTGCEAATLPNDITKLKEELMSNTLITTCSDANLPYFGIPLSVYNFLFSMTFLLLIIFNAYKKEK